MSAPEPAAGAAAPGEQPISRRALAARGREAALALGSGSVLAAAALAAARAAAAGTGDAQVLAAVRIQQTLRTIYGVALRSGKLNAHDRKLAAKFRAQSQAHAKLLAGLLGPGARLPKPPKPSAVHGLGDVRNGHRYLDLALGFEDQAYLGLIDALDSFSDQQPVLVLSQLAASTAQHLALLRSALGQAARAERLRGRQRLRDPLPERAGEASPRVSTATVISSR